MIRIEEISGSDENAPSSVRAGSIDIPNRNHIEIIDFQCPLGSDHFRRLLPMRTSELEHFAFTREVCRLTRAELRRTLVPTFRSL
jgi:hypothetical protein